MKDFDEWLTLGIENNWISKPYCDTHEGHPYLTVEQEKEFDEGHDPCVVVIQLKANE